jgi:hypothetical protein
MNIFIWENNNDLGRPESRVTEENQEYKGKIG